MTYFNTNNESGEELKQSRRNASTQEQEVMEIFVAELRALTPSEVLSRIKNNCPLTSIRRAITNLTKDGFLKKTDGKKAGIYGKNEHEWVINNSFDKSWSKPNDVPPADRLSEQRLLPILSESEGSVQRTGGD